MVNQHDHIYQTKYYQWSLKLLSMGTCGIQHQYGTDMVKHKMTIYMYIRNL